MTGYVFIAVGLGLIFILPIIQLIERIAEGLEHMADAQAQALADLSAAIDGMAAEVTVAAAAISAALASAGSVQPDDSALIEAQVTRIKNATAALTAAVPAPVVAPPAAPAA